MVSSAGTSLLCNVFGGFYSTQVQLGSRLRQGRTENAANGAKLGTV